MRFRAPATPPVNIFTPPGRLRLSEPEDDDEEKEEKDEDEEQGAGKTTVTSEKRGMKNDQGLVLVVIGCTWRLNAVTQRSGERRAEVLRKALIGCQQRHCYWPEQQHANIALKR
jgi:N-methylhydantoinase A/oxoprolinase/acetone carboxylase beta subunit